MIVLVFNQNIKIKYIYNLKKIEKDFFLLTTII